MSQEQVTIRCPFCRHKGTYPHDPPGSTLRCAECKAVFRMPASVRKHRRGEVLQGEKMQSKRGRQLVLLGLLVLLIAGGVYAGVVYIPKIWGPPEDFEKLMPPDVLPRQTSYGTLQRVLVGWQLGRMDVIEYYCTPEDRRRLENAKELKRAEALYQDWKLKSYRPLKKGFTLADRTGRRHQFDIEVTAENVQSGVTKRGEMKPIVQAYAADNQTLWGVDLKTCTPVWD